jgi:hypothetical protein
LSALDRVGVDLNAIVIEEAAETVAEFHAEMDYALAWQPHFTTNRA